MQKLARDYCFTTFDLTWKPEDHTELAYCSWQHEKCPTSGNTHIQGYAEFKEKVQWDTVKKVFGKAHVEQRRGTQKEAIAYTCKKESQIEDGWEWGTMHKQGARNDLKKIQTDLDAKIPMSTIAQENFETYIKFHRGFEKYQHLLMTKRNNMPEVTITWGDSGCGKTRRVYEKYGYDNIYKKDASTKWWDGYTQQKVILIDDYDNSCPWTRGYILNLLDRYPMMGETKGGHVEINSPIIEITSNYEPKKWNIWDNALERRIKETITM